MKAIENVRYHFVNQTTVSEMLVLHVNMAIMLRNSNVWNVQITVLAAQMVTNAITVRLVGTGQFVSTSVHPDVEKIRVTKSSDFVLRVALKVILCQAVIASPAPTTVLVVVSFTRVRSVTLGSGVIFVSTVALAVAVLVVSRTSTVQLVVKLVIMFGKLVINTTAFLVQKAAVHVQIG